jgi:hypothetical protein
VQPGGPVEVLDSSDGHLRTVPSAGCSVPALEEEEEPQLADSDGTFMLECGSNTYAALYARTGRVQPLPAGYDWRRIGSLYAEQGADGREEPCHTTIIDLATGALSVRAAPRIYDLDRPGAPALPICARLRQGVHTVLKGGEEVGVYQPGMFVHEVFERSMIVIERCSGPQTTLHPDSDPRDLQLGHGLLSWDTGLPPREERPEENAVLTAYSLRNGSTPCDGERRTSRGAPARTRCLQHDDHVARRTYSAAASATRVTMKTTNPRLLLL